MIEYVMRIIQNVFNNVNTAAETPLGETVVSIIVIILVGIIVCIIASGIGMIVASIFKGIRINLAGMLAAVIAEFVLLGSVPEKGLIEYLIGGLIILAGLVGCGMTLIIGKEYGWGKCSKKQTGGYAYYYASFMLSLFELVIGSDLKLADNSFAECVNLSTVSLYPNTTWYITPESPLWFIGEKLTTVEKMIDEEPEISDFYAGGMGWALEYNDFLLFSSDMEYDYARVTTVSPYTGCELFDGYRMGYLRLSELKDLLGNYDVEQNLASGYYVLASEFRFREDPQNYYSMVFSFENGYDTERCTMLTTYVSSEPVASTSGNYYDDGEYDDYYDDSYYDDYDYPAATEPTSGPYDEVIQNLHDSSDARSVIGYSSKKMESIGA